MARIRTRLLDLLGLSHAGSVANSEIHGCAAKGDVSRKVELAANYFIGCGAIETLEMAPYLHKKAADHGDPKTENKMAHLCQTGMGVHANPIRASLWFQLWAASCSATGKANFGAAYSFGTGVPQHNSLAARLFDEVFNKESGLAATYAGDLHFSGKALNRISRLRKMGVTNEPNYKALSLHAI